MSSMMRKMMRSVRRNGSGKAAFGSVPAVGAVRAGMHQAAEHEYRRSRMAEIKPAGEASDLPAEPEEKIPPEGGEETAAEEIAEGTEMIAADEEILEEVSDPEASMMEEAEGAEPEVSEVTLGARIKEQGARASMAVDWSGETLPVMEPVTGGIGAEEDAELIYVSGDAAVKEIVYPAPSVSETVSVSPYVPEAEDPSANVAAMPEEAE